jgi:tetratricopeptide (TPR) repeat protein
VPEFLIKAFSRTDPTEGSRDLLAVEVLDQAVVEAGIEFSEQPLMQARIFEALAQTYLRLGFYKKAGALVASAEGAARHVSNEDPELPTRLLRILSETRRLERRVGEAVEMSESNWREVRETGGTGSDEEMRARNEWITNLINAGELDRAEVALEEALAVVERFPAAKLVDFQGLYASLRWAQGRHDEAKEGMETRLAQRASTYLASDHDLMWRIRHYSRLLIDMGRLEEAEAWSEALVRCAGQVYGINHHLSMEAVAIRAHVAARRGSSDAAYFIARLVRDEVRVRDSAAPGLPKLDEHLSALGSNAPHAEGIDAWFEGRAWGIASIAELPRPLDADPAIWVALSDHEARTGVSEHARLAAERAYELSRSLYPEGDPRLTVRTALLIDLLSGAGKMENAESVLKTHWTPALLGTPTGRFLVDACEQLVECLDETGEGALARRLDRELLVPALVPLAAAMTSGRLSRSYHRIDDDLRDQKNDEERMRFQEMVATEVEAVLPVSDPFRRLIQIRVCEMLIAKGRVEEAQLRFRDLKKGVEAVGESVEIIARLDLMVLESKLLRAAGDPDGAGNLLVASLGIAESEGGAGVPLEGQAKSNHLRRLAAELQRHYKATGDEAARLEWAQWDLLKNVVNGHDEDIHSRANKGDFEGIVEVLEKQSASQFLTTEKMQQSLRLAEWLADELEARGEAGIAARAAMETLRIYRRLGQGSAPLLRQRFLQVQRSQLTLPSDEARSEQLSEIENIFAQLLGPDDRQTWTIRSHRLVYLHSVSGPGVTRPLIEEYFEAFPEEEKNKDILRLWFSNHLARCLLDLGVREEALERLEAARVFAGNLEGTPGISESELRGARIMTSNLFARFHREMENHDLEKYWLKLKRDLEAQK